jgi:lipopolysaccharide/colanic/teichoic acid biosynthesis glycosyltransferase
LPSDLGAFHLPDIGFSILVLPFALLFVAPVFCGYPFFAGGGFVFRHYRVGQDGRHFYLYKIRRLKKNHNNPRVGMVKGDGTVIPVLGHFLRANRIDELPQIWNILRVI